jgi:hypothetical protein
MDVAQQPPANPMENPAAVADAEQHALEEIESIRGRVTGYAGPIAAAAGLVASGWLIRRWRRRH